MGLGSCIIVLLMSAETAAAAAPVHVHRMPLRWLYIHGVSGKKVTAASKARFNNHCLLLAQKCDETAQKYTSSCIKDLILKARKLTRDEMVNQWDAAVSSTLVGDDVLGGLAFESTGMGEHARYHAGDSSYKQFTEHFASLVVDWYKETTSTLVKQTDIGYLNRNNAHFGKMCCFCYAGVKSMIRITKDESYFVILPAGADMVGNERVQLRPNAEDTLMCTRCHGLIDNPEPETQDRGRAKRSRRR